ncbi:MAN2C1 [Cordylochernes scorpioides]|uniref:MAN2C1 n=1 Tax=Cordylochernes scorpioides TaxID=51811 RepID=A0ABY6K0G6_9ARAC|nr:MAN2C1 [Cordylochernes scorpioides]
MVGKVICYAVFICEGISRIILEGAETPEVCGSDPLRVSLKFRAKLGSHSRISQKIVIDAVHPYVLFDTRITWGETHKFLKVEFQSTCWPLTPPMISSSATSSGPPTSTLPGTLQDLRFV